jgi:hypothetical protein
MELESWCKEVAALGVDMLIDAGLIRKKDASTATAIIAEEIQVRLAMGDYPPSSNEMP